MSKGWITIVRGLLNGRGTVVVACVAVVFACSVDRDGGMLTTVSGHQYIEIQGELNGDFGSDVEFVGDVDGDGLADMVLLDYQTSNDTAFPGLRGAAYLFFGRARFPAVMSATEADLILRGASDSVTGLGDIDADGYDDFAFSSNTRPDSASSEVRLRTGYQPSDITNGVHIVYGGSQLPPGEFIANDIGAHLVAADDGDARAEHRRISGAGDVNGDGYDDILIDVSFNDNWGPDVIVTYLVLGSADRLPNWGALELHASATFSGSDGTYSVHLGSSPAGDMDGDGYAEVLISNRSLDPESNNGSTSLYYGRPDGWQRAFVGPADADLAFAWWRAWETCARLGDLDADGYDDMVVSSQLAVAENEGQSPVFYGSNVRLADQVEASTADFSLDTPTLERFGGLDVAAGDVDGDGHTDLVVADWLYNSNMGALFVLPGSGARLSGSHLLDASHAVMFGEERLVELGTGGSTRVADNLGTHVASGGDINGDGFDDILVSALGNAHGDEDGGRVFVVLGGLR